MYTIENDRIIIDADTEFDIESTLLCGQVFRYEVVGDVYSIIAGDKRANLYKKEDKIIIDTDSVLFFEKYFDFDRNYGMIMNKVKDKALISTAMEFGKGIRILNQIPYETIISFIISANNNIPRIKGIIDRMCTALGENKGEYYAFPTLEALSSASVKFYESLGAGYRAKYIYETANQLLNDFDIDSLHNLSSSEAKSKLLTLKGVGPKVADCILLFGYHFTDVFPVDTWILKVYNEYYGQEANPLIVREKLVAMYGGLSGYVQQYLFYYKRELDKNKQIK